MNKLLSIVLILSNGLVLAMDTSGVTANAAEGTAVSERNRATLSIDDLNPAQKKVVRNWLTSKDETQARSAVEQIKHMIGENVSFVDIQDEHNAGYTLLHSAIVAKNIHLFTFILSLGANPTIHSNQKKPWSVVEKAGNPGFEQFAEVLRQYNTNYSVYLSQNGSQRHSLLFGAADNVSATLEPVYVPTIATKKLNGPDLHIPSNTDTTSKSYLPDSLLKDQSQSANLESESKPNTSPSEDLNNSSQWRNHFTFTKVASVALAGLGLYWFKSYLDKQKNEENLEDEKNEVV